MQNHKHPYIDHNSWMSCFGELEQVPELEQNLDQIPSLPTPSFNPFSSQISQPPQNTEIPEISNNQNQQIIELICLHESVDKELFKRSHSDIMMDEDFFTSNSSSSEVKSKELSQENIKSGYKKEKYAKQYIYSKNYRDKKKQQFKLLQQQNNFLKNKIDQLQARLREKQLQINRLKHHSLEKQLTIEELNRQFLTKVSLFAEKIESVMEKEEIPKISLEKKKCVYNELIKTYDEHGFAGSRKKEILGYHMNEILQVVLRDSEKYLCMLCCKNKDEKLEKQLPEYQKINTAFFEIMQMNHEDQKRLQKYIEFLFPIMKEIRKQCTDLYKNYSKILASMEKVHQFMKISYTDNLDFVKKRMKVESWFEYHKYHRIMRRLKEEWLDMIKKEKNADGKDTLKNRFVQKKQKN